MIREAAYAGVMTAASAVATSKAIPDGPVIFDLGGISVPIVPALIGVLTALLVRIIVITSPKARPQGRNLRAYNISITLLTMLGTAVYVADRQLGPGAAFGTGLGCGALGVGLVELGKSQLGAALRAGLQTVFSTMFSGSPKPPK